MGIVKVKVYLCVNFLNKTSGSLIDNFLLNGEQKSGGSVTLKSSADFAALAMDLGPKFKKAAKSKDVTTFVSDLLSKGAKDPVEVEDLNNLIKCKFIYICIRKDTHSYSYI